MASSNIKLFDENKGNMLTDTEFNVSTQRLNGLQAGVASSQLQNKAMYQTSLVAYAIAQVMMQNGKNANDTDAVSAFVANLSGTMLQKVYDIATTAEAQDGVATGKWMSPALVKAAIDTLAAKAQNILSNDTKALYGLSSNAVPDDVFLSISNYANFYVWEKTKRTSEYIEKRTRSGSDEYIISGMYDTHTYNYSSSISIDQSSGSVSLVNPQSMQKQPYNQNDIADAIRGKYFTINDGVHNGIYLCITVAGNTDNSVYCSAYDTITSELVIDVQSFGYVLTPTNDSPVEEGYIFVAFGQLGNKTRIATGSYVGTGTYGSSNPNSLTFDFEPKTLMIYPESGSLTAIFLLLRPDTTPAQHNYILYSGSSVFSDGCYACKNGNAVQWYNEYSSGVEAIGRQLNKSGAVYYYIAIG